MTELDIRLPEVVRATDVRRSMGVQAAKDLPTVAEVEAIYRDGDRDAVIARAMADGKFTESRAAAYRRRWDESPEATRALIAQLEPALEIGGAQ
jgi:hypothetical protein